MLHTWELLLLLSLSVVSVLSCSLMPSLHQPSLFGIPSAHAFSHILYASADSISSFCTELCISKFYLNFTAQLKCCFLQDALPDSQPEEAFFASSSLQHPWPWSEISICCFEISWNIYFTNPLNAFVFSPTGSPAFLLSERWPLYYLRLSLHLGSGAHPWYLLHNNHPLSLLYSNLSLSVASFLPTFIEAQVSPIWE